MKPVVEVEHLSKLYRLGDIGASSLRESLETLWVSLRGRKKPKLEERQEQDSLIEASRRGPRPGTFWSLRDVSFTVNAGEVIGVVGRNGAGKSTLLKILSRITEPTEGRAILRGRVVSLLEVGTGFHPELSGRENIFLNGTILGMKRSEIARKFDEIVDFAEVGEFIDTPVKRYSSGMFVRLAFAVAAHLDPEILLIDEVLAVGDAAFQKKCLGKMGEVATRQGRTVFFVSHNMGAVRSLCEKAILIENGRLTMDGRPGEIISHYLSGSLADDKANEGEIFWSEIEAPGSKEMRLRAIRLLGPRGEPSTTFEADKPMKIELHYDVLQRLRGARNSLTLLTQEGEVAFCATDHLFQPEVQMPGSYRAVCQIPGGLLNRRNYIVSLQCDIPGERYVMPIREYLSFTVSGAGNQSSNFPESWPGILCPKVEWKVEQLQAREVMI
jgi:lipopolysaccharide transport system ATP-binding protein